MQLEGKITGNKFELVMAVGRVGKLARQVAFFCVYIEPRMRVAELEKLCDMLNDQILQLKAKSDPLIFLGGDLNRRCLNRAVENFIDIKKVNFLPTRGDACLDVVYSNASNITESIWPPLENREGVKSDHSCLILAGEEAIQRNFTWVRKTARKHTDRAAAKFGREMQNTNWTAFMTPDMSPSELVHAFEQHTQEATDRLFPLRTIRCRSNEDPWITDAIRKLSKQKKRVFKREGKSNHWCNLQRRMDEAVQCSQSAYLDRVGKEGTRAYFGAVKALGTKGKSADWSLGDLFPNMSEREAGNTAGEYFTKISSEFQPLTQTRTVGETRRPITEREVEEKLKAAKKPNSSVRGDVLPRLVKKHYPALVKPVTMIFNSIFASNDWPSQWKVETAVVIPKVPNPESLAECRNISCTAFMSKVLESVLLEDLRREIPADPLQYGGIKGSSVDHLLIDLLDNVMGPLDEGKASAILSIDFEKAFNRLNHAKCLKQLRELGASEASIALVRSFLTGRTMQVKTGAGLSDPMPLCGGSPQGSILGCLLYCLTTQQINPSLSPGTRPTPVNVRANQATAAASPNADGSPTGMDVPMAIYGVNMTDSPASSDSSPGAVGPNLTSPTTQPTRASGEIKPPIMFKYVDDTTTVETLPLEAGARHITTGQPVESYHAAGTEGMADSIVARAEDIGMRVNCKKTQLLCMSGDDGYKTTAEITVDGQTIQSCERMKLLGFTMGTTPGAGEHVEVLKARFRAHFWSILHLKQAGVTGSKLFRIYAAKVRPILETNAVVFHPMLTKGQAGALERLQALAVKLCFGTNIGYSEHLQAHQIMTLDQRRQKAAMNFARKTINNRRFAEKWLVPREEVAFGIRRRRPYIEKKAKTLRYYRSPLLNVQRLANDIMTS